MIFARRCCVWVRVRYCSPWTPGKRCSRTHARTLDGFLFTGGGDVDPQYFHQPCRPWSGDISPRRDAMELTLCRLLLPTVKPVLGVCRGFQVMNIALGGDVYQDIPKEFVPPTIPLRTGSCSRSTILPMP